MSTTRNPSLPPLDTGGTRSLSPRRRGSVAAPDPFGTFPDTARTMTSTLHILKAPVSHDTDERSRRMARTRARSNSGGSMGTRISFAFSGFSPGPPQRDATSRPRSTISEPSRSASPLDTRPLYMRSNSFTNLPTTPLTPLTPIQVYDLAQQCNNPPHSPAGNLSIPSSPVHFTPLPEAYQLPFLDRPNEVKDLLSQPVTSKLFLLLAQTFPTRSSSGNDADPSSWTYPQLEQWLTQTTRDAVDDVEWVHKAKLCISARSELLWERIKAALGVPPELDTLDKFSDIKTGSSRDVPVPEGHLDGEDFSEFFGDTWLEPILASPVGSSPIPPPRSPTSFSRPPAVTLQGVGRMEDISEDVSESDPTPTPTAVVHGLRVIISPSEPPARRFSHASPLSVPPSIVPYDAVAERGPGHPLFPSSFANLALGPTLHANNPSLRSPSVPPASAFSSSLHPRQQVAGWAKGCAQIQEYALTVASE